MLCKFYEQYETKVNVYHPLKPDFIVDTFIKKQGRCNGTNEKENCSCEGNEKYCTFYYEVRERARIKKDETYSFMQDFIAESGYTEQFKDYVKAKVHK